MVTEKGRSEVSPSRMSRRSGSSSAISSSLGSSATSTYGQNRSDGRYSGTPPSFGGVSTGWLDILFLGASVVGDVMIS